MTNQTAITKDNVSLSIDGVLYIRVVDPVKASYGVDGALWAATQLAQTSMRSELGKLSLDAVFAERDALNAAIVESISAAASGWGLQVLRYEIRDISPPNAVRAAMELQAEAERRKRAQILESEGARDARVNVAQAAKAEVVLASEAAKADLVNRAQGEAEATRARAEAEAEALRVVAAALEDNGDAGGRAATFHVAERYVQAFGQLAKESTTLLMPSAAGDPAAMVAQALAIYGKVVQDPKAGNAGTATPLLDQAQGAESQGSAGNATGGAGTWNKPRESRQSKPTTAETPDEDLEPGTPTGGFSLQRK